MACPKIEVVVQGDQRAEANSTAYVVARALEAAGASVVLASTLSLSDLSTDTLRGVQVTVGVREVAGPAHLGRGAPRSMGEGEPSIWSTKFVVGLVVLLALMVAEIRLKLGPAAMLTVLGLAGWVLWHHSRRQPVTLSH